MQSNSTIMPCLSTKATASTGYARTIPQSSCHAAKATTATASAGRLGHLSVPLIGKGFSSLDGTGQFQGTLFDGEEREKQSRVDAMADEIKACFGAATLRRVARWTVMANSKRRAPKRPRRYAGVWGIDDNSNVCRIRSFVTTPLLLELEHANR
jgi:hypothetical protein